MKEFLRPTRLKLVILGILMLVTIVASLGFAGEAACIVEGPCPASLYQEHPALVIPFKILTWPFMIAGELSDALVTALYFSIRGNWTAISAIRNTFLIIGVMLVLLYHHVLACFLCRFFNSK